ncbi:hypothetical protein Tco_1549008 [Tanacetum coccineum]
MTSAAQQVALDNALVPLEKRVKIGKRNMRINPAKTQKEPTYQVVLDALALTTCYPAFLIIADIYPRLLNQEFDELPLDEEIVSVIKELGKKGDIKSITEVVVDHMYQPWRSFASIINKCLSGKITDLDKLRLLRAQILWGTYLAFATGATSPKKARKFKKPASPSMKRTLVTVEEEEPEPAKKVKKAPAKAPRSKGINLLSKAALLEEAQLKRLSKEANRKQVFIKQLAQVRELILNQRFLMSQKASRLTQGDIGDEANVQGDDEDVQDIDDEPQHADDERTDSKNQETNDDEEETDDEFVHTPPNYVPTDDETNDVSKDVDEEEYDRIDKELYGDVNVRLTDAEQDDEGKEDAYMTDVEHVQVEQTQEQTTDVQEESGPKIASVQGQFVVQATTTTPAIQNVTIEVPPFSLCHFVSSNYTSAFLNLKNLHSTEPEVVSMLDINVQHEVPHTSPLLTIPVSVIPEHTIFNPSETITTSSSTTISSLLSSLFPSLQQSTLILTPTTIEATTSTTTVLESKTLNAIYLKLSYMEK